MTEERNFIYALVIEEFLGLSLKDFDISLRNEKVIFSRNKESLVLNDTFFSLYEKKYLEPESLPSEPLEQLDLSTNLIFKNSKGQTLPIIYGHSEMIMSRNTVELGVDLLGSCFFMLTRYEEIINQERDSQDRFSAFSSVAYKNNFLERPIVDEYVEVLWACITYLWPELTRKEYQFKQYISCDVDFVWDRRLKFPQILKTIAGDVIKRKSVSKAIRSMRNAMLNHNPFDTFDFLMSTCEDVDAKLAFYFISRENKELIDGDYDIASKYAISLIKEINQRGHEIGIHPSYYTYLDKQETVSEKALLEKVLREAGVTKQIKGGRQHYLRWKTPDTARNWEAMGVKYDSTLGYADSIGFRCGTCREFPFFDVTERRTLDILIRPLIAMEVTLFSKDYMALNPKQALLKLGELKRICREFKGNFTLLWHNNYFDEPEYFEVYKKILEL